MEISKAQIGAWGEFLVQRELLELGIDSSRMTTDTGIDLVAYDKESRAFSIQVKTSGMVLSERRPDWKIRKEKLEDADLFAFVLKNQHGETWYFGREDLKTEGFLRLYNNEWALTFYRTGAPEGRHSESDMAPFKGLGGLERFISRLRMETRSSKAKAVARRN